MGKEWSVQQTDGKTGYSRFVKYVSLYLIQHMKISSQTDHRPKLKKLTLYIFRIKYWRKPL